ncbi:pirin family protein [Cocleimonas sp. KMM 6892]|uniref:pirin family protein n=1 Tax=unclassified Cocleimonas TaxID=2639732 RepID=UPI002DBDFDF0|nr:MULTISPECIES: pirin family protein [unclassified Cocleimonas]MEB8430741.1 pirin family protein [Cocleimonas sp. KMM 6892]MEC4714487.1 pirin family protein [Cocleimonas sp. KMM 6895]MEC4743820.1 pirin family protein [Cocleimonas sp. KMM 6896]
MSKTEYFEELNMTIVSNKNSVKELVSSSAGFKTTDGDGVSMVRLVGTAELDMVDPFLLLDAFGSDEPNDYIGGFPPHPHRGFETVTYLLEGKMRHKDNAGNEGVIESGGVQWMTAGKGIVHSEMPEQENGMLQGFQLWVNLPAEDKMTSPAYQEFSASEVPLETWEDGTTIRVVAGITEKGTTGPVKNDYVSPLFMDVSLVNYDNYQQIVDTQDNTLVYVIDGEIEVGLQQQLLPAKTLGILEPGEKIMVKTKTESARFLVISARPLNEKVARGGPFVMNTQDEVRQAFDDFRNNRF